MQIASHNSGDSMHCTAGGADEEMEKGRSGKDPNLGLFCVWGGRKKQLDREQPRFLTSTLADCTFAYHFTFGLMKILHWMDFEKACFPKTISALRKNNGLKPVIVKYRSHQLEHRRGSKCLFYKMALGAHFSALVITVFFITWKEMPRTR